MRKGMRQEEEDCLAREVFEIYVPRWLPALESRDVDLLWTIWCDMAENYFKACMAQVPRKNMLICSTINNSGNPARRRSLLRSACVQFTPPNATKFSRQTNEQQPPPPPSWTNAG